MSDCTLSQEKVESLDRCKGVDYIVDNFRRDDHVVAVCLSWLDCCMGVASKHRAAIGYMPVIWSKLRNMTTYQGLARRMINVNDADSPGS